MSTWIGDYITDGSQLRSCADGSESVYSLIEDWNYEIWDRGCSIAFPDICGAEIEFGINTTQCADGVDDCDSCNGINRGDHPEACSGAGIDSEEWAEYGWEVVSCYCNLELDECGICDGDGYELQCVDGSCENMDCMGVCGGLDIIDECWECGGGNTTGCADASGEPQDTCDTYCDCFGNVLDDCGNCGWNDLKCGSVSPASTCCSEQDEIDCVYPSACNDRRILRELYDVTRAEHLAGGCIPNDDEYPADGHSCNDYTSFEEFLGEDPNSEYGTSITFWPNDRVMQLDIQAKSQAYEPLWYKQWWMSGDVLPEDFGQLDTAIKVDIGLGHNLTNWPESMGNLFTKSSYELYDENGKGEIFGASDKWGGIHFNQCRVMWENLVLLPSAEGYVTPATGPGPDAATSTITITDYTELNSGDKVNLIDTDGMNYDFTNGSQSLDNGTWESTTSNNDTATNLMDVINTIDGPSGTKFTATVADNAVTVTQSVPGPDGNTNVTLTDSGTAGMSKTNFTGGIPGPAPAEGSVQEYVALCSADYNRNLHIDGHPHLGYPGTIPDSIKNWSELNILRVDGFGTAVYPPEQYHFPDVLDGWTSLYDISAGSSPQYYADTNATRWPISLCTVQAQGYRWPDGFPYWDTNCPEDSLPGEILCWNKYVLGTEQFDGSGEITEGTLWDANTCDNYDYPTWPRGCVPWICEDLCSDIPEGECCLEINEDGQCIGQNDCYGNVLDECGVCGGDNSSCNAGCTDPTALNYCPSCDQWPISGSGCTYNDATVEVTEEDNILYQRLILNTGQNLISFFALPEDTSIENVLGMITGHVPCDGSDDHPYSGDGSCGPSGAEPYSDMSLTAIIGEAVAANYIYDESICALGDVPQLAPCWVGSLTNIKLGEGYWINVSTTFCNVEAGGCDTWIKGVRPADVTEEECISLYGDTSCVVEEIEYPDTYIKRIESSYGSDRQFISYPYEFGSVNFIDLLNNSYSDQQGNSRSFVDGDLILINTQTPDGTLRTTLMFSDLSLFGGPVGYGWYMGVDEIGLIDAYEEEEWWYITSMHIDPSLALEIKWCSTTDNNGNCDYQEGGSIKWTLLSEE